LDLTVFLIFIIFLFSLITFLNAFLTGWRTFGMVVCEESQSHIRHHSLCIPELIALPCCIKNVSCSTIWLKQ